jgi:hypothetical protein
MGFEWACQDVQIRILFSIEYGHSAAFISGFAVKDLLKISSHSSAKPVSLSRPSADEERGGATFISSIPSDLKICDPSADSWYTFGSPGTLWTKAGVGLLAGLTLSKSRISRNECGIPITTRFEE